MFKTIDELIDYYGGKKDEKVKKSRSARISIFRSKV